MTGDFKSCPACSESIPADAILCRFCGGRPSAPADPDGAARAQAASDRIARQTRRATPFLAIGWVALILFLLSLPAAFAVPLNVHSPSSVLVPLLSGCLALACLGSFLLYLALRPLHLPAPCPACREFALRRVVRPGVLTARKTIRCDSCGAEVARTGF